MGVATSTGIAAVFDIRSTIPLATHDHMYSSPVHSLHFHQGPTGSGSGRRVVSADKYAVRVWGLGGGSRDEAWASVEPQGGVEMNDVLMWSGSGLMLLACDSQKIQVRG